MIDSRRQVMKNVPTSSIFVLQAIAAEVTARGAEPGELLRALGVPAAALEDIDARAPLSLLSAAWQLASELVGDPDFGLHFAEKNAPGAFDLIEYLIRSSATFGDSLSLLARFFRLL